MIKTQFTHNNEEILIPKTQTTSTAPNNHEYFQLNIKMSMNNNNMHHRSNSVSRVMLFNMNNTMRNYKQINSNCNLVSKRIIKIIQILVIVLRREKNRYG